MATARVTGAKLVARSAEVDRFAVEHRLAGLNILIAFLALAVGGLMGIFQALEYSKINVYPAMKPVVNNYYQGLSMHGVLNVLVFTTFFIVGWLTFVHARALDMPLVRPKLAWATFWVMVVGLLMAAVPLLLNSATVLFTAYPPLMAAPPYYIGLTLVVVGTWLLCANMWFTYRAWRAQNPLPRTPLPAFMGLATITMWTICTIGIGAEMLFMLIPWSLGLVGGTDPILARTLFWFTGHPIVYFWLLPAYISWYTLVPRQGGGKLFSDPMARVSFILFLVLSVPIGLHHQITDPGISEIWKLVHGIFTFGVFFPSLLTFFNVNASLESAGRARGGKGWLAWIFKLPWNEPSFVTQVLAMILFAFGGVGGLINASYNVNLVVHNTSWISGHFHLTVGSAVTMTFMGICYWLVPYLTKRRLWSTRMALAQAWTWFVGMALFSHFMHTLGLTGMPRRTDIGATPYFQASWAPLLSWVLIGALLMFVSAVFFYLNLGMTIFRGVQQEGQIIPWARAIHGPEDAPAILDRWKPWLIITAVLIVVNYVPVLFSLISTSPFNIPGVRP